MKKKMVESLMDTVELYNKVIGTEIEKSIYDRLLGKVHMYEDVMGVKLVPLFDKDGHIEKYGEEL